MSEVFHTPGPWKVVTPAAIDWRDPQVYGENGGTLVCQTYGGGPKRAADAREQRANAALIALAPEMLAALEQVMVVAKQLPNTLADVREVIDPLLAKMKGGTP